MTEPANTFDLIQENHEWVRKLEQERLNRPDGSGFHLEDYRISSEISVHLFQLGQRQKALTEQISRSEELIKNNQSAIAQIARIIKSLKHELDIATFQKKPYSTED